jgi:hypothetical protein
MGPLAVVDSPVAVVAVLSVVAVLVVSAVELLALVSDVDVDEDVGVVLLVTEVVDSTVLSDVVLVLEGSTSVSGSMMAAASNRKRCSSARSSDGGRFPPYFGLRRSTSEAPTTPPENSYPNSESTA